MPGKSAILSAWHAQLKKEGIPATSASKAAESLCRVFDQQFSMRDTAHGDLQRQINKLKTEVHELKNKGDAA